MKHFNPEDGNQAEFSRQCETLESRMFPDGEHGTCDYCYMTFPKWGMSYNLTTSKLSCGCHKGEYR